MEQSDYRPMPYNQQAPSRNKYVLVGMGLLGLAALAGLGYYFFIRPKSQEQLPMIDEPNTAPSAPPANYSYQPPADSTFPLSQGSRGKLVQQIQSAIGVTADGIWGPKTTAALKSKGHPTTIDAQAFAKITGGTSDDQQQEQTTGNTHEQTSKLLLQACNNYDFDTALKATQRMKNITDYKAVSNYFKTKYIRGTRYTIVNALLTTFIDPAQKESFKKEFLRMGLKFKDGKWALEGLGSLRRKITTTQETTIWNQAGTSIEVPAYTVLGQEVFSAAGVTTFQTIDGKTLHVSTKAIKHG